jgi:hypothetical protein
MTPREFQALRDVWQGGNDRSAYMNAQIVATLYNAHFVTEDVPWTPEDILGKGNREERLKKARETRWTSMRIVNQAERAAATRDGSVAAPEWLLGVIADNEAMGRRVS